MLQSIDTTPGGTRLTDGGWVRIKTPPAPNRLAGVVLDKDYKLGLHHEATPETRQQLIGCIFGVWLVFFGRTMKKLTLTTIGTVAAVLAFSTGCSQNKIEELEHNLKNAHDILVRTEQQLTKARRAQKEAEQGRNIAQGQAESAMAALRQAKQELAQQKQRVGQLQRVHSLKVAEYEAFVAETAQALAAKDKKISELSAPVK